MGDPTDRLSASAASPAPPAAATVPSTPTPKASAAPAPSPPPAGPPSDETVESHFWLTRSDQLIFGLLSLVAVVLLIAHWIRLSHWGTQTVEIERLPARQTEFRLDANAATWVEWSQIQGIGDGLARRIVADREQNGPFGSVDDLGRVKGIGPKTLEHLRPWVRVDVEPAPTEPPPKRKRSRARTKAAPKPAEADASAE
jgi:competence protein ComEA